MTDVHGRDSPSAQGRHQQYKSISVEVFGHVVEELSGRLEQFKHILAELEKYMFVEITLIKLNTIRHTLNLFG